MNFQTFPTLVAVMTTLSVALYFSRSLRKAILWLALTVLRKLLSFSGMNIWTIPVPTRIDLMLVDASPSSIDYRYTISNEQGLGVLRNDSYEDSPLEQLRAKRTRLLVLALDNHPIRVFNARVVKLRCLVYSPEAISSFIYRLPDGKHTLLWTRNDDVIIGYVIYGVELNLKNYQIDPARIAENKKVVNVNLNLGRALVVRELPDEDPDDLSAY